MSNRNFYILLFLIGVVYAFNLRLDVMEIDAAQYAAMSWQMLTTHSFLQIHCINHDYLDKPPLLFWLGSLSFSAFGFNNFAYKLPSVLFAALGIFSTYRLAKMYYDEKTARMSAIMLASTQALFMITNDVRTDTLLMGAVIFATWQLAAFFEDGKTKNILLGSIGLGLALLAKGPIGLIATGAALAPHFILKGYWKKLLDLRLIAIVIIMALMLLPMCIGLYQQYGVKGLQFYFWTQSFGRITGDSEWNNHPDTFFLWHTTAWAFLPWSLFLVLGWGHALLDLVKKKLNIHLTGEIISVSGFTLVLLMLSLSKYQLPHYIFVVYPLAAIMAAKGFMQLAGWPKVRPWLTAIQLFFIAVLPVFTVLLQYLLKGLDILSIACVIILYPAAVWLAIEMDGGIKTFGTITRYVAYRFNRIFSSKSNVQLSSVFALDVVYQKLFYASALMFIVFNFMLSAFYYPVILKYQPEGDFGRYIHAHKNNNFVCYKILSDYALIFYMQQIPRPTIFENNEFKQLLDEKKSLLVYTSQAGIEALNSEHIAYHIIEEREAYHVANLTGVFLNPATRASVCERVYLMEVGL